MKRALIQINKCVNCERCEVLDGCPMTAVFREAAQDKPWVDFYRCSGCMQCKTWCVAGAIEELTQPCTGRRKMGW